MGIDRRIDIAAELEELRSSFRAFGSVMVPSPLMGMSQDVSQGTSEVGPLVNELPGPEEDGSPEVTAWEAQGQPISDLGPTAKPQQAQEIDLGPIIDTINAIIETLNELKQVHIPPGPGLARRFELEPVEDERKIVGGEGVDIEDTPAGITISLSRAMQEEEVGGGDGGAQLGLEIEYGKPTTAFSSGTTITLDPTDQNGVDNGQPNITVYLAVDASTVERPYATTDVLSFIRYDTPDAAGVEGNLCGLLSGTEASVKTLASGVSGGADLDAAQADTWDRASQGATDGFTITVHRPSYSDTGDEVLHGQYRTITVDSAGMLAAVTAETEYEIDTPVECPTDLDGGTY